MPIRLHVEDRALLSEAIRFTSAETGFIPRLIEKDYFCSVVLEYLAAQFDLQRAIETVHRVAQELARR